MKTLNLIKYLVAFCLLVVLTSFKPTDKFTNLEGGNPQIEIMVIND